MPEVIKYKDSQGKVIDVPQEDEALFLRGAKLQGIKIQKLIDTPTSTASSPTPSTLKPLPTTQAKPSRMISVADILNDGQVGVADALNSGRSLTDVNKRTPTVEEKVKKPMIEPSIDMSKDNMQTLYGEGLGQDAKASLELNQSDYMQKNYQDKLLSFDEFVKQNKDKINEQYSKDKGVTSPSDIGYQEKAYDVYKQQQFDKATQPIKEKLDPVKNDYTEGKSITQPTYKPIKEDIVQDSVTRGTLGVEDNVLAGVKSDINRDKFSEYKKDNIAYEHGKAIQELVDKNIEIQNKLNNETITPEEKTLLKRQLDNNINVYKPITIQYYNNLNDEIERRFNLGKVDEGTAKKFKEVISDDYHDKLKTLSNNTTLSAFDNPQAYKDIASAGFNSALKSWRRQSIYDSLMESGNTDLAKKSQDFLGQLDLVENIAKDNSFGYKAIESITKSASYSTGFMLFGGLSELVKSVTLKSLIKVLPKAYSAKTYGLIANKIISGVASSVPYSMLSPTTINYAIEDAKKNNEGYYGGDITPKNILIGSLKSGIEHGVESMDFGLGKILNSMTNNVKFLNVLKYKPEYLSKIMKEAKIDALPIQFLQEELQAGIDVAVWNEGSFKDAFSLENQLLTLSTCAAFQAPGYIGAATRATKGYTQAGKFLGQIQNEEVRNNLKDAMKITDWEERTKAIYESGITNLASPYERAAALKYYNVSEALRYGRDQEQEELHKQQLDNTREVLAKVSYVEEYIGDNGEKLFADAVVKQVKDFDGNVYYQVSNPKGGVITAIPLTEEGLGGKIQLSVNKIDESKTSYDDVNDLMTSMFEEFEAGNLSKQEMERQVEQEIESANITQSTLETQELKQKALQDLEEIDRTTIQDGKEVTTPIGQGVVVNAVIDEQGQTLYNVQTEQGIAQYRLDELTPVTEDITSKVYDDELVSDGASVIVAQPNGTNIEGIILSSKQDENDNIIFKIKLKTGLIQEVTEDFITPLDLALPNDKRIGDISEEIKAFSTPISQNIAKTDEIEEKNTVINASINDKTIENDIYADFPRKKNGELDDTKFTPEQNITFAETQRGKDFTIRIANNAINALNKKIKSLSSKLDREINPVKAVKLQDEIDNATQELGVYENYLNANKEEKAIDNNEIDLGKLNNKQRIARIERIAEDATTYDLRTLILLAIAKGAKFRWSDSDTSRGMGAEMFANSKNATQEFRERISLWNKKGFTADSFAHAIYEDNNHFDIDNIKNEVISVVLNVRSQGDAIGQLEQMYQSTNQEQYEVNEDPYSNEETNKINEVADSIMESQFDELAVIAIDKGISIEQVESFNDFNSIIDAILALDELDGNNLNEQEIKQKADELVLSFEDNAVSEDNNINTNEDERTRRNEQEIEVSSSETSEVERPEQTVIREQGQEPTRGVEEEDNSNRELDNSGLNEEEKLKEAQERQDLNNSIIEAVDSMIKDNNLDAEVRYVMSDSAEYEAKAGDRKALGWFDRDNSTFIIVVDNNSSVEDALQTLFHELIGHKGLLDLIGKDKHNALMERVFDAMPMDKQQEYYTQYKDKAIAADEYLATLAEEGKFLEENKGIIQTIIDFFREVFNLNIGNTNALSVFDELINISYQSVGNKVEKSELENRLSKIEEILGRKQEIKEQTLDERLGLEPTTNIESIERNIANILTNYSGREMAALQVENYLNEHTELGKEYLNKYNINTRKEFAIFLGKLQTNLRKGKGKEMKQAKIDSFLSKIEEMTINAQAEMDAQIEAYVQANEVSKKEESKPRITVADVLAEDEKEIQTKQKLTDISNNDKEVNKKPNKQKTISGEKIEDFGEKIGGARKDLAKEMSDKIKSINEDDIANLPLSKIFPKPNYIELKENGMSDFNLILLSYIYDNLPTKPRSGYGINRYVSEVKNALNVVKDLLNSKTENFNTSGIENIFKLKTYILEAEAIGFPYNVLPKRGYEIKHFVKGDYAVTKGYVIVRTATTEEEIKAKYKELLEGLNDKKDTKVQEYSVYQSRATKLYFITPKGKANIIIQNDFKTSKEAFEYIRENRSQLDERYSNLKELPSERNEENRDRIGADWTKGKNITNEQFAEIFGFRGIEYGNWVNQNERQERLNQTYNALMDLSSILGISPRAISLNGELAMAFGSRGTKGASAHYEPDKIVINLTKKNGAGSLAHEWFHALDNYFSRRRGQKNLHITDMPRQYKSMDKEYVDQTRPELLSAFNELMQAINKSDYKTRSKKIDELKSKKYWGTPVELSARAFESYIVDKLADNNVINDYLANFKGMSEYLDNTGGDIDSLQETYPYPMNEETKLFNEKFDALFETIEEDGNNILFRESQPTLSPIEKAIKVDAIVNDKFMKAPNGKPTNLTEKQWLQVRTPEFKAWFGDWENSPETASKVIDLNGEPLVVYHGSADNFTAFDKENIKTGNGFWFTKYEYEALGYSYSDEYGNVLSVFLNIKKPATKQDREGVLLKEYEKVQGEGVSSEAFIRDKQASEFLKSKGYDGLLLNNGIYIAFSPNQIKSATDNTGAFSGNDADIRFREIESIKDRNRQVLRNDEYGKNIVWENGDYYIAVDSEEDAKYISLWYDNKKIGFLTAQKGINRIDGISPDDILLVGKVEIDKKHRGNGLSKPMYKALIDFSANNIKAIASYLPDRVNKKQVPNIWNSLGGKTENDYDYIRFRERPYEFDKETQTKLDKIEEDYNNTPEQNISKTFGFSETTGKQYAIQEEENPKLKLIKDYLLTAYKALGFKDVSASLAKSGTYYIRKYGIAGGEHVRIADHMGRGGIFSVQNDISTLEEAKDIISKSYTNDEIEESYRKGKEKTQEEQARRNEVWESIKDDFKGLVFKNNNRTYQTLEEFASKGQYPRTNIYQNKLDGSAFSYEWTEPTEYDKWGNPTNYGKDKPSDDFIDNYIQKNDLRFRDSKILADDANAARDYSLKEKAEIHIISEKAPIRIWQEELIANGGSLLKDAYGDEIDLYSRAIRSNAMAGDALMKFERNYLKPYKTASYNIQKNYGVNNEDINLYHIAKYMPERTSTLINERLMDWYNEMNEKLYKELYAYFHDSEPLSNDLFKPYKSELKAQKEKIEKAGFKFNKSLVSDIIQTTILNQTTLEAKQRQLEKEAGNGLAGEDGFMELLADEQYKERYDGVSTPSGYVRWFESKVGKESADELVKHARNMNIFTLNTEYEGGNLTRAEYIKRSLSKYYVPLRGRHTFFIDKEINQVNDEFANGKITADERNKLIKKLEAEKKVVKDVSTNQKSNIKAEGRKTLSDNPIVFMAALAETAIENAARNKMKMLFGSTLINNIGVKGNDFETLYQYEVYAPNGDRIVETSSVHPDESNIPYIAGTLSTELVPTDTAELKEASQASRIKNIKDSYERRNHVLSYKHNGVPYNIYIKDKTLKESIEPTFEKKGNIDSVVSRTTRWAASYMTSKNIGFVVPNMIRDIQVALTHQDFKNMEGGVKNFSAKFFANYGRVAKVVANDIFRDGEGNDKEKNKDIAEALRLWQSLGGKTGHVSRLRDFDKLMRKMNKDIKYRSQNMTKVLNGMSYTARFEFVEQLAEYSEDMTRFTFFYTLYTTMVKDGKMSVTEAVDQSKEASINFDKKGKTAKKINSLYSFFTATIGALTKEYNFIKQSPKKAAMFFSLLVVSGMLESIANALFFDDDEEKSEYKKLRTYHLDIWGIPVSQSFVPFRNIGFQLANIMLGRVTTTEAIFNIGESFRELLPTQVANPMSFVKYDANDDTMMLDAEVFKKTLRGLSPQVAIPLVDLYLSNEDFMGSTIIPENMFDKNLPMMAKYRDNKVYDIVKGLTNVVNAGLTRQNIREFNEFNDTYIDADGKVRKAAFTISPMQIQYLIDAYFAGTGKSLASFGDMMGIAGFTKKDKKEKTISERIQKAPVISSFYLENNPDTKYYKDKEKMDALFQNILDREDGLKRSIKNVEDIETKKEYRNELNKLYDSPDYKKARIYEKGMKKIHALRMDKFILEKSKYDYKKDIQEIDKNIKKAENRMIDKLNLVDIENSPQNIKLTELSRLLNIAKKLGMTKRQIELEQQINDLKK